MKKLLIALGCLAFLSSGSLARAQGVQTGTITGTVQSADSQPLPGVTVSGDTQRPRTGEAAPPADKNDGDGRPCPTSAR